MDYNVKEIYLFAGIFFEKSNKKIAPSHSKFTILIKCFLKKG
jgi:hypothetical protein